MSGEMSKDERKRLERLQEDGPKGVGGYMLKDLTYPDLQLLLVADETIRRLIRDICTSPADADDVSASPLLNCITEEDEAASGKLKEQAAITAKAEESVKALSADLQAKQGEVDQLRIKINKLERAPKPPPPAPKDLLREQLTEELVLLQTVQADTDLAQAWLRVDDSEGRQLVRLLALLSDWDEVLSLWSRLASRCKEGQRAATQAELVILQAALSLHNLRYRDRAATLVRAEIGVPFHHETMERGSVKGATVAEVWLPGIGNAAEQLQKKPVVKTT